MALTSGIKNLPLIVGIEQEDIQSAEKPLAVNIGIQQYDPIEVGLRDALISVISKKVAENTSQYLDRDRFLKTLLNFGSDTQRIIVSWRLDPDDTTKLLVKLLEPLDITFDVGNQVLLSREVANTVVDTIKLELLPQPDTSFWLRPKNTQVSKVFGQASELNTQTNSITNQTLASYGFNLTGSALNNGGYVYE